MTRRSLANLQVLRSAEGSHRTGRGSKAGGFPELPDDPLRQSSIWYRAGKALYDLPPSAHFILYLIAPPLCLWILFMRVELSLESLVAMSAATLAWAGGATLLFRKQLADYLRTVFSSEQKQ